MSGSFTFREGRGLIVDRERGWALQNNLVVNEKLGEEVVEDSAKIVANVTSDEGEAIRNGISAVNSHDTIRYIVLSDDMFKKRIGLTITEPLKSAMKSVEMDM